MKHLALCILLCVLWVVPAELHAQHLTSTSFSLQSTDSSLTDQRYPGDLYGRGHSPATALREIHELTLPSSQRRGTGFNTRTLFNSGWTIRDFTSVFESPSFTLWLETEEIQNNVVDTLAIDTVATFLFESTPAGSIDPARGIYENTVNAYGDLPDIDGDGSLDILWYDIRDDYPSTPQFIDHLVIPEDQDPSSPDSVGNRRDVIYVDTQPLYTEFGDGVSNVARATAVALQKLIHLGMDADEDPFLVSGLAYHAPLINGFAGPGHEYLSFPGEHNIGMFHWTGLLGDIQRSAAFVTYVTEQVGLESLGDLTSNPANGSASVEQLLAASSDGRSLDDLVLDFHTANLLNDAALDSDWGYSSDAYSSLNALATFRVDGSRVSEANTVPIDLAPGGVQYLQLDNVSNPAAAISAELPSDQSFLRGRLVGFATDGSISVVETDASGQAALDGLFDMATFVATNSTSEDRVITMSLETEWDGTAYPTVNVIYDDGTIAQSGPNFFELGSDFKQATYFANPDGYLPYHLSIAPFFRNQFVNSGTGEPNGDPSDPRDFVLCITDVSIEGRPTEDCLIEETYSDPRPFGMVTGGDPSLRYLTVDLSPFDEELEGIGDLFAVLSEAGTDDNVLVMGLSTYTEENVSFLYGPLGATDWYPLWNVIAGGDTLNNRIVPMRMQFQDRPIIIATEEIGDGSSTLTLTQNFPNPFRDRTTIEVQMQTAQTLTLAVYDLLGREVARIADGIWPPGTHRFTLESKNMASGLYLYRLRTGDTLLTRTMILSR